MSAALASPPTATKFSGNTKLFINGEWTNSSDGATFDTHNPATGETIAKVAHATKEDVDRAVKSARKALEKGAWGKMDARLEALNCGKTITDSRGDVGGMLNGLRYYAGWADKIEGKTVPVRGSFLSYTLRQPVGVVGQIIPWNFPLLMAAWKWGPALACGNTIVMKAAEQTPLSVLRVCELVQEAGFPPGVINLLNGMGETTGDAMVTHPDIDKIAFTGHVDTAKLITKRAADTLKRTTFELGGKSPNVVFADCDMDQAVAGAFHAIYFHGGQCCTAGSRLFIEEKIKDEFVSRLAEKAGQRRVGNQLDEKTEQGPQVSQEQLDKILGYVELGQQQGAKLVAGGKRVGDKGFFVEPTIFDNVTDDMAIAKDEIFGPVVSVLSFKDADDMIERANTTQYGLAAAVWTKNIDKAHWYAKNVKAGTVWVNCYHIVDVTTPFGGFKMSGQGRENGEAALEHYTETKTVTIALS